MVLSACSAWPAHSVVAERCSVTLSLCMNPLLMVCVAAMRHIKQMFITVRQCPLTVEEREWRDPPPDRRTGRLPPKCCYLNFPFTPVLILSSFTKPCNQINAVSVFWSIFFSCFDYFAYFTYCCFSCFFIIQVLKFLLKSPLKIIPSLFLSFSFFTIQYTIQ